MSGPTFGWPMGNKLPVPCGHKYKKLVITLSQVLNDPSDGKAEWFRVTVVGGGGGGGGGYNAASSYYGKGGGGGEGIVMLLHKDEIQWPKEIIVGVGGTGGGYPDILTTNGTSTSFGSQITALGGNGGQSTTSYHSQDGASGGREAGHTVTVLGDIIGGAACQPNILGGHAGQSSFIWSFNTLMASGGGGGCGNAASGFCGNNSGGKSYGGGGGGGGGASLCGVGGDGATAKNLSAPSGIGQAGAPGYGGGGGGGGGGSTSSSNPPGFGAKGGDGICIIEWYE